MSERFTTAIADERQPSEARAYRRLDEEGRDLGRQVTSSQAQGTNGRTSQLEQLLDRLNDLQNAVDESASRLHVKLRALAGEWEKPQPEPGAQGRGAAVVEHFSTVNRFVSCLDRLDGQAQRLRQLVDRAEEL